MISVNDYKFSGNLVVDAQMNSEEFQKKKPLISLGLGVAVCIGVVGAQQAQTTQLRPTAVTEGSFAGMGTLKSLNYRVIPSEEGARMATTKANETVTLTTAPAFMIDDEFAPMVPDRYAHEYEVTHVFEPMQIIGLTPAANLIIND